MDWILEFLRRGLIGAGDARRVGHQIDLHLALGDDLAGLLVESEIIAVNLIEARGIAAVQHNADVVQLGVAVQFELFDVAGLDGEEGALAIGLGILITVGRLLNVDSHLAWNLLEHIRGSRTRVEVHPSHEQREQHGGDRQQAAQAIDLERHLGSV